MATTAPIKDAADVVRAIEYIEKNYDPVYSLLWRLISTTGLRVSDALALSWDAIDWHYSTARIIESKGTKSALARATRKEKQQIKLELLAQSESGAVLYSAPVNEILDFIDEKTRPIYEARLERAKASAPAKTRTIDIEPGLLEDLRQWHRENYKIDGGHVFSKNSMKAYQAKKGDRSTISRQAAWGVFRDVGYYLTRTGSPVRGSCHGLRKTYAYHLASETGNLSLVVKTMNWSSVQVASRYLGHDDAERIEASKKVFNKLGKGGKGGKKTKS
jgi:integrase